MKLRFKATANAPEYAIENEVVNGIDLSQLKHGDRFIGDDETRAAGIRHAERDADGVLRVTLQQAVGPGHWTESGWIDASQYDADKVFVVYTDKAHGGTPYAVTARGKADPRTGEVIDA
jgi:hypothetical protein